MNGLRFSCSKLQPMLTQKNSISKTIDDIKKTHIQMHVFHVNEYHAIMKYFEEVIRSFCDSDTNYVIAIINSIKKQKNRHLL